MKLKWIISGSVLSFVFTFVIVFIIAVMEYFTGMSEGAANVCAYISAAAGVFAGALFAAGKAQTKPLINAMPVALIYIAAIIAASFALKGGADINSHTVSLMAGIIFAGFLGALLGQKR